MEVQHNLAHVLRVAQAGQPVGITRRKKLVAKIVPISDPDPELPDFTGRAQLIWSPGWSGSSSEDLLQESRNER